MSFRFERPLKVGSPFLLSLRWQLFVTFRGQPGVIQVIIQDLNVLSD